jgi:hypothetical protein|tara:strand:- start:125 stop:526 length:402 start_codon:yes stop_codon:yes gene_type:complete
MTSKKNRVSLSSLMGKGVQMQENKKSLAKKDKIFFINLLGAIQEMDLRSDDLLGFGINIIQYEDPYHQIIEGLLYKCYGAFKADLIFWWLDEKSKESKKNITITVGQKTEYTINTPIQLYTALMKIDKQKKNA